MWNHGKLAWDAWAKKKRMENLCFGGKMNVQIKFIDKSIGKTKSISNC